MQRYRLDPTLKSLGKRLDSLLCDIARLPLSPPMQDLLARLHQVESPARCRDQPESRPCRASEPQPRQPE